MVEKCIPRAAAAAAVSAPGKSLAAGLWKDKGQHTTQHTTPAAAAAAAAGAATISRRNVVHTPSLFDSYFGGHEEEIGDDDGWVVGCLPDFRVERRLG